MLLLSTFDRTVVLEISKELTTCITGTDYKKKLITLQVSVSCTNRLSIDHTHVALFESHLLLSDGEKTRFTIQRLIQVHCNVIQNCALLGM